MLYSFGGFWWGAGNDEILDHATASRSKLTASIKVASKKVFENRNQRALEFSKPDKWNCAELKQSYKEA